MTYLCTGCGREYTAQQQTCLSCGAPVVSRENLVVFKPDTGYVAAGQPASAQPAAQQVQQPAPVVQAVPTPGARLMGLNRLQGARLSGVYGSADAPAALSFSMNQQLGGYVVTGQRENQTEVVIPESYSGSPVVAIGESAFANSGVVSVTVPASVRSIGASAFENCASLTAVHGCDGVEQVGDKAFMGCIKLNQLQFTKIPAAAYSSFAGCFELGLEIEAQVKMGGTQV